MDILKMNWAPFFTIFLLASCATAEYKQAESGCRAKFLSQIPPQFEQEFYNKTETREVPTGRTTCTGYGYTVSCQQVMTTEYYTVPAVRTVDRNAVLRDPLIESCTQTLCSQQYGNLECKTNV